jgi:hypothetical protein
MMVVLFRFWLIAWSDERSGGKGQVDSFLQVEALALLSRTQRDSSDNHWCQKIPLAELLEDPPNRDSRSFVTFVQMGIRSLYASDRSQLARFL